MAATRGLDVERVLALLEHVSSNQGAVGEEVSTGAHARVYCDTKLGGGGMGTQCPRGPTSPPCVPCPSRAHFARVGSWT